MTFDVWKQSSLMNGLSKMQAVPTQAPIDNLDDLKRLAGINTPEIRGDRREAGLKSKDFVTEKILDKEVIIITKKDAKEKFGRYLAWIYYQENAEWVCINNKLIDLGLAEPYM